MAEARDRLRRTFDGAAPPYDEARPGYPEALFDDVVALSGIPPRGTSRSGAAPARPPYISTGVQAGGSAEGEP